MQLSSTFCAFCSVFSCHSALKTSRQQGGYFCLPFLQEYTPCLSVSNVYIDCLLAFAFPIHQQSWSYKRSLNDATVSLSFSSRAPNCFVRSFLSFLLMETARRRKYGTYCLNTLQRSKLKRCSGVVEGCLSLTTASVAATAS